MVVGMASRRGGVRKSKPKPAATWMAIRVRLVSGRDFEPAAKTEPPGRVMLASTSHTFAELGFAIDRAFARWDLAHEHEFELEGGVKLMLGGDVDGGGPASDSAVATLAVAELKVGSKFAYTFDLGDCWEHECEVVQEPVALEEVFNLPPVPVAVFGWGAIPDQHGRVDGSDFVPR